jgi:GNAT superfamily N-acetyltransferase
VTSSAVPASDGAPGPTRARVRAAEPRDVPAIDALVRELADYEREPDAVEATPEDFASALFGPDPRVHAHVVEVDLDAGAGTGEATGGRAVVGMALWYVTFSTWRGRHGIWLEDLFVRPEHRGAGLGRALLQALAAEADRRGYARLEWWVLDWNTPAHGFYRSLGASPQDEWTVWRLDGERLTALGGAPPVPGPSGRPAD